MGELEPLPQQVDKLLLLLPVTYSDVFYYFFLVLVVTHHIDFMTRYWLVTHNLKNIGLEELTTWHSSVLDQHFLHTRHFSSVQGILGYSFPYVAHR